ncbi:hypothetical protein GCM10022251_48890 [Phytohabitans flavus]|uniref:Uncharacterized protein n=1 Tax=Phytohabitans flavus TaxID=1076124 RepID=A0A6F8XSP9_9ACTN|nr:hypothetical protein [Phytohabitans flavus]BCB76853.1 hypothetical protein Pflav_032630 [Phytohabitans flavus]
MKPIFVDRSGHRRRLVRVAGAAAALALTLASALLVAGFTGAGAGRLPLLPEPAGGRAGDATKSPRPEVAPAPTTPRPSPRPDDRTTPGTPPTTSSVAPITTTAVAKPGRSSHRRVPTHTPGNKPSKPG